ncbi:MAG TPA: hypothetical protein VGV92_05635 [Gammaproteobacteria bacterium]|nr:hypothetical protein [Gammaproteobacteria bacterium]
MQQEITYPYSPITGNGLGTAYSSLSKIGSVLSQKGIGAASLVCYPNLSNGNLFFQDRILRIAQPNFALELGFVYNSQATDPTKAWRFAHKKFASLSANETVAVLEEADGHVTKYVKSGMYYYAEDSVNGTKFMRFDEATNFWILHDSSTGIVEFYDKDGLLRKKTDVEGRATTYEYTNGQLSRITTPALNNYEIRRDGNSVAIYDADHNRPLQLYTFDNQNRLLSSSTPDAYGINYTYKDNTALVNTVQQSDGTQIAFTFLNNTVQTITTGKSIDGNNDESSSATSTITYADNTHPNQAWIEDGINSRTTMIYDQHNDTTQVTRQNGYNLASAVTDNTIYTYHAQTGQLETITHPGAGIEHRDYDPKYFNLLKMRTEPNGQIARSVYITDSETIKKLCDIHYEDVALTKPVITRYVYEPIQDAGTVSLFLRFKISPEGRVTEYRRVPSNDPNNRNTVSERTYLDSLMKVNGETSPPLAAMEMWLKKQNPSRVSLKTYGYDSTGQINKITRFTDIDANGNGIVNAGTGVEDVYHNIFGNIEQTQIKTVTDIAITSQSYDDLQRVTRKVDALKNETKTEYLDHESQLRTTYANGKINLQQLNPRGLAVLEQASIDAIDKNAKPRNQEYLRDVGGRVVVTTLADKSQVYTYYDRQNRLGFTVTALGIVTEFRYDAQNRFNTKIQYAQKVAIKKLWISYPPKPGVPPDASQLIAELNKLDSTGNHVSYTFFDKSGREAYTVDAENFVTQYFYDNLNRKIATVAYATKLSDTDLAKLKTGVAITLPQDFTKDSCSRLFYDNDGLLIGRQDPAGFVTQFVRDAGGRIAGKVVYYAKATLDLTLSFDALLNAVSGAKKGVTLYAHDARGQIIAKLNAEGFYTEYSYSPNGLRLFAKAYANKPTGNFPSKPVPSDLDQATNYEYDLLGRKTKTHAPFNRDNEIQFDNMGNIISNKASDSTASKSTDGDHLRQTATQYDGWGQAVNKANVYVGQLLAQANGDPDKIKAIWANQSQRNKYDETGLLLYTTDPLGFRTYFYYDADRRPVVKISANLSVEESTLNSSGKEVANRKYANFYTGELTGGFITTAFQQVLTQLESLLDQIQIFERNKRDEVTTHVDGNGNTTTKDYNYLGKVSVEVLPVNSQSPTLEIKHGYDTRGNETSTTKTDKAPGSTAVPIIETREFDNPLNIETQHVNAIGGVFEHEHDLLGNVTVEKSDGVIRNTYTHDFLNRVATAADADNNTTTHKYGADHTHTVISPTQTATLVSNLSVFNDVVTTTDGEDNTTSTVHTPDGQVCSQTDQLDNTTTQEFDLNGQKDKNIDPLSVETKFKYTGVGTVDRIQNDATGLQQSVHYGRNAQGNATDTTDPKGILIKQGFDQNNNIKTITTDAAEGGLGLMQTFGHNAQGKVNRIAQGDTTNPDQYVVVPQIDGFNRNVGKIVDPENLKITTSKALDAEGNTTKIVDPSGNITRNYFNTLGQRRFKVTATGGLRERFYDDNGRIRYQRFYDKKVDVTDATTFDQLKVLAATNTSSQDGLLYYFYDANGNEKYRVNSLGAVSESIYNNANPQRVIRTVLYYKNIDPKLLNPNFKTSDLAAIIKTDPKDRATYFVRDKKGQAVRKINGEGYVTANVFNANGKPIVITRYANKLNKPIDPNQLPLADPANDRVSYLVYDNLGRKIFEVEAMDVDQNNGRVTKFDYDENNNPIQVCKFGAKFLIPQDYDQMVIALNALDPKKGTNAIDIQSFDNANRLFQKTNADNKFDHFELTSIGLTKVHTNKAGNKTGLEYDGAKRLKKKTSPTAKVTSVKKYLSVEGVMTLTPTQTDLAVEETTDYYPNGKIQKVTKGSNTDNPRAQNFTYDGSNQLASTKIEGVEIDDPKKDSSYFASPTETQNIETHCVNNAKNLKVAEQNENGLWAFTVYNSEGKEVYLIGTDGSVHQKVRNTFQEVVGDMLFAEATTLDLSKYITTGIPLADIENDMAPKRKNLKNRANRYTKDNVGNTIVAETGGPVVYYALVKGAPTYGMATPVANLQYNAFREQTARSTLQYPTDDGKGVWSDLFYWRDRVGNTLAQFNTNGRVDAYAYDDAFHKYTKLNKWGGQLKQRPTAATTYSELMSYYQQDPNTPDQKFERDYDILARTTADRQLEVVVQVPVIAPVSGVPSLQSLPPKTLETSYQWDAMDNKVMTTFSNGSRACVYFDVRNLKVAETDVTRTSQDQNGAQIQVTPLTYFYPDAYGQSTAQTRFKLGTTWAYPSVFPLPIALSPEDQQTVKLFDIRGLPGFTQDGESRVTGHTFTPTRKIGRNFHYLTDPDLTLHVDDTRYTYGLNDQPEVEQRNRDNKVKLTKLSGYNMFSEIEKAGYINEQGQLLYPELYDRDVTGKIWRTNTKTGAWKLKLRNLAGYECLSADSVLDNYIASLAYADLPTILATADFNTLERKQTERDLGNRAITTVAPMYEILDPNKPQNIITNAVVGNNYPKLGATSISWQPSIVGTCVPVFTIWPIGSPEETETLTINYDNNQFGVDVSAFLTDVYAYQINYYLRDQNGGPSALLKYQGNGVVQCDTGHTNGSQRLVVDVKNDSSIVLTGNTTNLTAIKLFQNNLQVGPDIEVPPNRTIDLSKLASGTYTIQPVVTGQQDLPQTLPFTIHTPIPSATPLSLELDSTFELKYLYQAQKAAYMLELDWAISESSYNNLPVEVTIEYTIGNSESAFYTTTVTRKTDLGEYKDSKGNPVFANIAIPLASGVDPTKTPITIKNLTVAAKLDDKNKVTICNNYPFISASNGDGINVINDLQFLPTTTLYIVPETQFTEPPVITYLNTSSGVQPQWNELKTIGITDQGVVVDVTGFPDGNYPFTIGKSFEELRAARRAKTQAAMAARKPGEKFEVALPDTEFTIGHGSQVYTSIPSDPPPKIPQTPTVEREYNNFDKVTSQKDMLDNVTTFTHDMRSKKVAEIAPVVTVQLENGDTVQVQPVTQFGFNERGHNVGTTDGNGHTTARILDEANQLVQRVLPSGLEEKEQVFDALQRCVTHLDSRKEKYTMTFDRCDNLLARQSPNGDTQRWTYDELNSMNTSSDPAGNKTSYFMDINGNIIRTALPQWESGLTSNAIEYEFSLLTNQMTSQTNPASSSVGPTSLLWDRDYFGRLNSHTDLSGAFFQYQRDGKNQVTREWSTGGNHGETMDLYIETVKQYGYFDPPYSYPFPYLASLFKVVTSPTPNKDMNYSFRPGGLLQEAHEAVTGKTSIYHHNAAGTQIGFEVYRDGNLMRSLRTDLDALNREVYTWGPEEIIQKGWDRTNNIVYQQVVLIPPGNGGNTIVNNGWNSHDADDNVLIYGGDLVNKQIVRGNNGWAYTYQNGLRYTQSYKTVLGEWPSPNRSVDMTETLVWDVNSRLDTTQSSFNYRSLRNYNNAGQINLFQLWSENGVTPSQTLNTTYDGNGWVTQQVAWSSGPNNSTTNFSNFDIFGNPWYQESIYTGKSSATDRLNNAYVGFDNFQPSLVAGNRTDDYGTGDWSAAQNFLTSTGGIAGQRGVQDKRPGVPEKYAIKGTATNYYETDAFGNMLMRYEFYDVDLNFFSSTNTARLTRYFSSIHWDMAGSYGTDVTPLPQFLWSYFNDGHTARPGAPGTGPQTFSSSAFYNEGNNGRSPFTLANLRSPKAGKGIGLGGIGGYGSGFGGEYDLPPWLRRQARGARYYGPRADFKIGQKVINPVTNSFPPLTSGEYVVNDGDTLASISQNLFGDSSYAGMLGTSNGVTDQMNLSGRRLKVPDFVQSKFSSSTSVPYNQLMSSIVANLFPLMNTAQPPDDNNFWETMIDIVIVVAAIVVSVVTLNPEIAGGTIAAMTAAEAATAAVEAGVMAAAIAVTAEVATEELETQLGWRQHFSLRHAAQIAVEAGFGAASFEMGPYLASLNIGEEMLAAGVMSTTEQLGEMGLGMQSQFEIQDVIEAMMEAAVPVKAPSVTTTARESATAIAADKAMAKEIGSLENTAVDTVASGISDHMFEGQPINVLSMAENALGSAIENAAITEFAPQPKQTSTTTLKPTAQQTTMDELDDEIHSLENDIKSFFDPSVVSPNAQKVAPSVAKKLSRQGMFKVRNTPDAEGNYIGKGLDLTDDPNIENFNPNDYGSSGSAAVSKMPTTATSSTARVMRVLSEANNSDAVRTLAMMDPAAQAGFSDILGASSIGTSGMNLSEKVGYYTGEALGAASMLMTPDGLIRVGSEIHEGMNFLGDQFISHASTFGDGISSSGMIGGGGEDFSATSTRNYLDQKFGRTGLLFEDINYSGYSTELPGLDFSSAQSSSVYYAGGEVNGVGTRTLANIYARNAGKVTIDMTSGGKYLNQENLYARMTRDQADEIWARASSTFAFGASGVAEAVVPSTIPSTSIYNIERLILFNNPNVSNIIELSDLPAGRIPQFNR